MSCSPHIAVGESWLFASQTYMHAHAVRWTLSNEEQGIKVKRATVLHSELVEKGGRKGNEVGTNGKMKKGRWKAGAGVLRLPRNF